MENYMENEFPPIRSKHIVISRAELKCYVHNTFRVRNGILRNSKSLKCIYLKINLKNKVVLVSSSMIPDHRRSCSHCGDVTAPWNLSALPTWWHHHKSKPERTGCFLNRRLISLMFHRIFSFYQNRQDLNFMQIQGSFSLALKGKNLTF